MSKTLPVTELPTSQTLWATASKEWVVLPKPKPGRKPKADSIPQTLEGDASSRRTQNRAAQRAFRERKQSQLAELQARINSYEQGEIERNIALQRVAKRLKDENELLRKENSALKFRLAEFGGHAEPNQAKGALIDKKRGRDSSPTLRQVSKKIRDTPRHGTLFRESVHSFSSPSGSTSDDIHTLPYDPQQDARTNVSSTENVLEHNRLAPFLTCGFCEPATPCLCREIASSTFIHTVIPATYNMSSEETSPAASSLPSTSQHEESRIAGSLPLHELAVPIRRRNKGVPPNSVFPVYGVSPSDQVPLPTCSGDPNNCLACVGDSFGQAFCAAIGSSIPKCSCSTAMLSGCSSSFRCSDCPSIVTPAVPSEQTEMIPTNDAWQKIKTHPNAQFADLTLLAEVVARGSDCTRPQLSRITSHAQTLSTKDGGISDPQMDDPQPGSESNEAVPDRGRQRLRFVRRDGVRDALQFLDARVP